MSKQVKNILMIIGVVGLLATTAFGIYFQIKLGNPMYLLVMLSVDFLGLLTIIPKQCESEKKSEHKIKDLESMVESLKNLNESLADQISKLIGEKNDMLAEIEKQFALADKEQNEALNEVKEKCKAEFKKHSKGE